MFQLSHQWKYIYMYVFVNCEKLTVKWAVVRSGATARSFLECNCLVFFWELFFQPKIFPDSSIVDWWQNFQKRYRGDGMLEDVTHASSPD